MLERTLLAIGGGGGSDSGRADDHSRGVSGVSNESGGSGGSIGPAARAAAQDRAKTVLACLFEALGKVRALRELARVLCALAADTAKVGQLPRAEGESGPAHDEGVVVPQSLLPVLEALPPRSADVVGLALEVLATGQAAADVLACAGGLRGAGTERGAFTAMSGGSGR